MWSKEWKVSCRPRRARNTSLVAVSQMRSVVPALLQTVTRPVPVPSRRLPPSPRASQTLLSCCGQRHWEASRHPAITATVSGSQVLATWVVVGSNPLHLVGYLDHPTINVDQRLSAAARHQYALNTVLNVFSFIFIDIISAFSLYVPHNDDTSFHFLTTPLFLTTGPDYPPGTLSDVFKQPSHSSRMISCVLFFFVCVFLVSHRLLALASGTAVHDVSLVFFCLSTLAIVEPLSTTRRSPPRLSPSSHFLASLPVITFLGRR